ncbi:unnamed protein product [Ectocarpus sp. 4 AP-2014]
MGDQGRPGGPIRFKTTFTNTIYEAMKRRGWRETNSDSDWDFIWAERDIAYDTFDTRHLLNWQRVNHFRNDRELCRKDLLVKNLKKRKRSIQKEGHQDEADRHDFWPTTYVLPGEYALFAEESKKRANSKWIMKPIARSQGRGIFIVTKLSQISKWKSDSRWEKTKEDTPETYVVQRYVTNPYLVAGRKFDMRLYVLVTSYMPMTVWVYRAGFCRFSHARYSNATEDLEDMEKHLTNIAIQKRTESYDKEFGGKWGVRQLKLHLMALHGVAAVNTLFHEIQSLILRSLLSVQQVMINDKHCFGLYGYDILFDDKLKPWLLEVNASPSLSANTPADKELKVTMLSSVLDVIDLEGRNQGDEIRVGGFDLIHAGGSTSSTSPSANMRGGGGVGMGGAAFGDKNGFYTTALGAEIPQQRVDRMPRAHESSSSLPPSGASSGGGGNGCGTGTAGGDATVGGGGGSTNSPARTSAKGGGSSSSGGGSSGVGGGSSISSRASSSLARSVRATGSSDSLPKTGDGGGRAGRNEAGGRSQSRGSEGTGGGSSGGGSRAGAVGKGGVRSGDNHHRDVGRGEHRDRGAGGVDRNGAGGKDHPPPSRSHTAKNRDSRGASTATAADENKSNSSSSGKRAARSPPRRQPEDGSKASSSSSNNSGGSSPATSFPPASRESSSDSEKLLTSATAARKRAINNSFSSLSSRER